MLREFAPGVCSRVETTATDPAEHDCGGATDSALQNVHGRRPPAGAGDGSRGSISEAGGGRHWSAQVHCDAND